MRTAPERVYGTPHCIWRVHLEQAGRKRRHPRMDRRTDTLQLPVECVESSGCHVIGANVENAMRAGRDARVSTSNSPRRRLQHMHV